MHTLIAAVAPYLVGALIAATIGAAGYAVAVLKGWLASPAAAQHPIEASIAEVAVEIANDAIALLRSNPTLTPAAVITWATQELAARGPSVVEDVGGAAATAGINALVRKSLLSVAQGGSLDAAATAIISALAPTAATAKITPPQIAAVIADAAGEAPDLEAAIAAKLPAIIDAVIEKIQGTGTAVPAAADATTSPTPVPAAA